MNLLINLIGPTGGHRNISDVIEWKVSEDLFIVRTAKQHFIYPIAMIVEIVVNLQEKPSC